jgi:hypothetical protein
VALHLYWAAPTGTGVLERTAGAGPAAWLDGERLTRAAATAFAGHPLELGQRGLVAVLLVAVGLELVPWGRPGGAGLRRALPEIGVHLSTGAILLAYLASDQIGSWRDFRGLGPFLLLSSLVMLAQGKRLWFVGLSFVVGVALLPTLFQTYLEFRTPEFVYSRPAIQATAAQLRAVLEFRPDPNRWCNTLLVRSDLFRYTFVTVPAGIGVSFAFTPARLSFPLKSRYLLLDSEGEARFRDRVRTRLLATTELGTVYLNLDARCGPEGS